MNRFKNGQIMARFLSLALVTAWIPAVGWAQIADAVEAPEDVVDPAKVVQVELVADTTAVEAGRPLKLGVHFKIAPEWHIYWSNPGETGLDTKVELVDFKDGKATEVLYPTPIKFISPGPLVSYGYADETMLVIPVTPELTDAGAKEVTFKVKARWLMCKDRCIPGKTELTLTLPVGSAKAANQALFDRFAKLSPEAGEAPGVQVTAKREGKEVTVELTVRPADGAAVVAREGKGLSPAFFFPQKIKGIEWQNPVLPEPDAKVATTSGEVVAYTKPFVIKVKGALLEEATEVISAGGVLVLQQATKADGVKPARAWNVVVKP